MPIRLASKTHLSTHTAIHTDCVPTGQSPNCYVSVSSIAGPDRPVVSTSGVAVSTYGTSKRVECTVQSEATVGSAVQFRWTDSRVS